MRVLNEKNSNGVRVLAEILYDEEKQKNKDDLVKIVRNQKLLKEAEYNKQNVLISSPETITFDMGASFDKQNNRFNYNGYNIELNKGKKYMLGKLFKVSHNRLYIAPNENQIKYESSSRNSTTLDLKDEIEDDETYLNDSLDISLLMNRLYEEYFYPEKIIEISNYRMEDNLEVAFKKIIEIYNESLYNNKDKIKDIEYGSRRFEICYDTETKNKIFNELETLDLQISTNKMKYGNVIRDTGLSKFEILENIEKDVRFLQDDLIYRRENYGNRKIKKDIEGLKISFNKPFISLEDRDRFTELNFKKINNAPFTNEEHNEYINIINNFEKEINERIDWLKRLNEMDHKNNITSSHIAMNSITVKAQDAYRTAGASNDYYRKLEAKGEDYKVVPFKDTISGIQKSLKKFSRVEDNQLIASLEVEYDKRLDNIIEEESKNQEKYLQSTINNVKNTKEVLDKSIKSKNLEADDFLFLAHDIVNKNEDYNRFILGLNVHSGSLSIFNNLDYSTQEILTDILGEDYQYLTKNQLYDKLADSNKGYLAKYNKALNDFENFEKERFSENEKAYSQNVLTSKNNFETFEVLLNNLKRNIEIDEIKVSPEEKKYLSYINDIEETINMSKKANFISGLSELSENSKIQINKVLESINNTNNKCEKIPSETMYAVLDLCYEDLSDSNIQKLNEIDIENISIEEKIDFIGKLFENIDKRFEYDNFVDEFSNNLENNKEIELRRQENFGQELEVDSKSFYKDYYNQVFSNLEKMRRFDKLNDLFKSSSNITSKIKEEFNSAFTEEDISRTSDVLNHSFEIDNLVDVLTLRKVLQQDLEKINKQIKGVSTENNLLFEEKENISYKIKFLENNILNNSFYSREAGAENNVSFLSNAKDSFAYKSIMESNKEIKDILEPLEKEINEIKEKYQKEIDLYNKKYTKISNFRKRGTNIKDSKIELAESKRDEEINECMKKYDKDIKSLVSKLSNLEVNLNKTNEQSEEYIRNIEDLTKKGGKLYNTFIDLTDEIKKASINPETNEAHRYETKVASLVSGIITPDGIDNTNKAFNYLLNKNDMNLKAEHNEQYKNNYNYRLIINEFNDFNINTLKEIKDKYQDLVNLKQNENIDFISFKNSIKSITKDNYENYHFVVADSDRDKYLFNKLVNKDLVKGVKYENMFLKDIKSKEDLYRVSLYLNDYKENNKNKDLYFNLYKIIEKNNPSADSDMINNKLISLVDNLTELENTVDSYKFNLEMDNDNISNTLSNIVSQYYNPNKFLLCFELYDKNILLSSEDLEFNKETFADSMYKNSIIDFGKIDLTDFKKYTKELVEGITNENVNTMEAPSFKLLKYAKDNGIERLDEFFKDLDENVYKALPEDIRKSIDSIIDKSFSNTDNNISTIANNCVLNNKYTLSKKENVNKIIASNFDNVNYLPKNIKEKLADDKEFSKIAINAYIANPNEIVLNSLLEIYDNDEKLEVLKNTLNEMKNDNTLTNNNYSKEAIIFDLEDRLGLQHIKKAEKTETIKREVHEIDKNEIDFVKIDIMQLIENSDNENELKVSFYSQQYGEIKEAVVENVTKDENNPNIYRFKLDISDKEHILEANDGLMIKERLNKQIELQNSKEIETEQDELDF